MSAHGGGLNRSTQHFIFRVRPETSRWIAEFSEHEADWGEAQERERFAVEILPILGEPSAAIEPGNGALDDPAFGQDHKSADLIGTFDNFDVEMRKNFCECLRKFWSLIRIASSKMETCRTMSPSPERLHRDLECRPDERWRGAGGLLCRQECAASCP